MADEDKRRFAKRSLMELVTNAGPPPEAVAPPGPAAIPPEEPESSPKKKSDPLPKRGDAYRAHARFGNFLASDQKYLHFVHGDHCSDGFAYHDLRRIRLVDRGLPGQPPLLVLRFVEAVITEVTIAANRVDDLHHFISDQSMPWVWERPGKGFTPGGEHVTIITSINFEEIER
jgi:hypothetical protein